MQSDSFFHKIDIEMISQGEMMELSSDIPPLAYGRMISVAETTYLVGGSLSIDSNAFNLYHPMNKIYQTKDIGQ